jgi:hypothetical protein
VLPLTLEISPRISSVDEGSDRDFTINAYSGSDPVDGVEMVAEAVLGTASAVESLGIGGYQFTYTAPSVDSDSEETLTVAGSKNGYEDATAEISFTISDVDSSDKVRIEFVDPPKTILEGEETMLTVQLRSGAEPVTGADVEASASSGEVGSASEGDPGEYSFSYTAPDISSDTKVTITVTASSPPLEDGAGSLQLTVKAAKIIGGDEYSHSAIVASGDLEIHWTVSASELSMALKGRTAGWVAIGFGATTFMKDSDMIIGYVDGSGKAAVLDCHSTGNYGPHPADTQLGGADNLIATGGSERGGWTIIEFTRPLDSPDDRFDKDVDPAKKAELIWAIGKNDDPLSQHDGTDIERGTYSMDWSKSGAADSGKSSSAAAIALGAIGILFLVSGIIVILTRKKGGLGDPLRKAGMSEKAILYLGIGSIIVASVLFVLAILMIE